MQPTSGWDETYVEFRPGPYVEFLDVRELRVTVPVQKVLQALLDQASDEGLYGLELTELTGLKSGTLYPVLARLEQAEWVISSWEQVDPHDVGRPRRRYYRLSGVGQRTAASLSDSAQLSQPSGRPRAISRPAWGQA
jgi:DNA-binding MarR family transcriptional regulator